MQIYDCLLEKHTCLGQSKEVQGFEVLRSGYTTCRYGIQNSNTHLKIDTFLLVDKILTSKLTFV